MNACLIFCDEEVRVRVNRLHKESKENNKRDFILQDIEKILFLHPPRSELKDDRLSRFADTPENFAHLRMFINSEEIRIQFNEENTLDSTDDTSLLSNSGVCRLVNPNIFK